MNRKEQVLRLLRDLHHRAERTGEWDCDDPPEEIRRALLSVSDELAHVRHGAMLGEQVEKLIRAGNVERAIRLVEAMPMRPRWLIPVIVVPVVIVCAALLAGMVSGLLPALVSSDITWLPGDPQSFDPVGSYGPVHEFAGESLKLVGIQADFVGSSGTQDLTAEYEPVTRYWFRGEAEGDRGRPIGAGGGVEEFREITVVVRAPYSTYHLETSNYEGTVMTLGMEKEEAAAPRPGLQPAPAPGCSFAGLWKHALSAALRRVPLRSSATAATDTCSPSGTPTSGWRSIRNAIPSVDWTGRSQRRRMKQMEVHDEICRNHPLPGSCRGTADRVPFFRGRGIGRDQHPAAVENRRRAGAHRPQIPQGRGRPQWG